VLVASDVGGHKELIRHGETGQLFQAGSADSLADALVELLGASARWPSFRAAGRRVVETERNWANSVANYVAPYQRLVGAA
jgi:glycosyltransferase involved in cell wall biosynthesis